MGAQRPNNRFRASRFNAYGCQRAHGPRLKQEKALSRPVITLIAAI